MSSRADLGSGVALRALVGALALLLLAGLGFGAERMLVEEGAQASALVAEGRRAQASGDRGHAVLAFERARFLAPRAAEVRSALAAVEPATPAAIAAVPVVERGLRFVTAREWAALAVASGWLAGLAVAVRIARRGRARRSRPRSVARVAVAASGVFVVALSGVMVSNVSSLAVVTTGAEDALVAPYAGATVAGPLAAGATVVLGPRHEGFVRVRDGAGLTGWVPRSSLETVSRGARSGS